MQIKLEKETCDHLTFEEHDVYSKLLFAKKTCTVPGDIPVDIISEFLPVFISPSLTSSTELSPHISGLANSRKSLDGEVADQLDMEVYSSSYQY